MDGQHTVFLILGRTSSGKDSLVGNLCNELGLSQLISYTTRPMRYVEENTHFFVTEDDYIKMRDNNQIAAFTQIGEYKYWSSIDQLYKNDIYIIDKLGLDYLHSLNLPNIRIVSIYIHVPRCLREKRALEIRHDNEVVFYKREFNETEQFTEMLFKEDFDYAISNIDFNKAYKIFKTIVEEELKDD